MTVPFGDFHSGIPKSYPAQMLNAEKVVAGLNAGVDGFNRWSFVNRGDLDGQWQLVRTWNPIGWDYCKEVRAEPVPYYAYGILTRFTAKHSRLLQVQGDIESTPVAAMRSPKGNHKRRLRFPRPRVSSATRCRPRASRSTRPTSWPTPTQASSRKTERRAWTASAGSRPFDVSKLVQGLDS